MKFFLATITLACISGVLAGPREYEETCSRYKLMEGCRVDLDLVCEDDICVCKEMSYWDEERKACIAMIGESCTSTDQYGSSYYYGGVQPISRCPLNAVCETRNPNKASNKLPVSMRSYFYNYDSYNNNGYRCFCKPGYYADEDKEECVRALKGNEVCVGVDIESVCDLEAGLHCDQANTKTCVCKKSSDVVTYNDEEGRCLTKIGQNCSTNTFCEKNSICSTTLKSIKNRYNGVWPSYGYGSPYGSSSSESRKAKASKKREIAETGQCVCLPGYSLDSNGQCTASHSIACSKDNPCNKDHFLECIDGMCQCEAGAHQVFTGRGEGHGNGNALFGRGASLSNGTCKVLVNSKCVKNGPKCVKHSECIDGVCQCKKGWSASPSGQCLKGHDTECKSRNLTVNDYYYSFRSGSAAQSSKNASCNFYQGLGCFENKCVCYDSLLTWDEDIRMCTAGINERCGPMSVSQGIDGEFEPFYPSVQLNRPWNGFFVHSYYVACGKGLKCNTNFKGVSGWNVCTEKEKGSN